MVTATSKLWDGLKFCRAHREGDVSCIDMKISITIFLKKSKEKRF